MRKLNTSQKIILFHNLFIVIISLIVSGWIISSPSEQSNSILFGYSAPRLVSLVGLIFVVVFITQIMLKVMKNQEWTRSFIERWFDGQGIGRVFSWLCTIGCGLGWLGCFLPAYRMGVLENYWLRLLPAMVFILLTSIVTLVTLFIVRNKLNKSDINLADFKSRLPLFAFFLVVLGGMFLSGFGVASSEDFWYGAGVPILTSQLIMAIIGAVLFLHFEPRWQSRWIDVLVCILIYTLTVYLWVSEPLQKSFFFTGPSNLNHTFYPFSDAATFDIASQFPLIGKNFLVFNSVFFERPFYLSFLTYLHSMFGQNYEVLMDVQAATFAILPVLIYLIGKSLDFRSVGFGSAIVAMLRGVNSIYASNMIDMASPKMMLTDFPAAIGIAFTILLICEWLKKPENKLHYLVWIGGVIGLTLMVRTNALILLAFVPAYLIFQMQKRWLTILCLIILGFISVTLPWEIRNLSLGGHMYAPIFGKIQDVINQRYVPKSQSIRFLPQNQTASFMPVKNIQKISVIYRDINAIQDDQSCNTVICFSLKHFLHNSITSILILPTSPMMDDIRYLVKSRFPHYWDADWNGTFTEIAPLFFVLNIFFITMGIVFIWREKRLAGLTPLVIFVIYNMSNGLARTSGGRYIVPIDWIIPLYYMFGIYYIVTGVTNSLEMRPTGFHTTLGQDKMSIELKAPHLLLNTIFVFVILHGIGWLIPASENLYLPRYRDISPHAILMKNQILLEKAEMNLPDLNKFIQEPQAGILIGRALYPRHYEMDQGDMAYYLFATKGFPRTTFTLIGPTGEYTVVLPGPTPMYFPHASDVLVLGCTRPSYFDAQFVIIFDTNSVIYIRKPESKLQCPLQQPN